MRAILQNGVLRLIDWVYAAIPRRVPSQNALRACKIIAHRGETGDHGVLENTLQAFRIASAAGVWGIECDIRWSADLVPLIHHDASCKRLFGDPAMLSTLPAAEIRARFPLIPTLREVLTEFGGRTHLMLEIKEDHYPDPDRQKQILRSLLAPFTPGEHFHILTLDPDLAQFVDFLPANCWVLVAEMNMANMSKCGLRLGFGGLSGHFLLLTRSLQERHSLAGQRLGVGFIHSRNSLFRELNRGIDWIFSNDAVKIQSIRDHYLQAARGET